MLTSRISCGLFPRQREPLTSVQRRQLRPHIADCTLPLYQPAKLGGRSGVAVIVGGFGPVEIVKPPASVACGWRIRTVTQQSAFGRARDSASANGMKQSL
jgi:hypothetical protein